MMATAFGSLIIFDPLHVSKGWAALTGIEIIFHLALHNKFRADIMQEMLLLTYCSGSTNFYILCRFYFGKDHKFLKYRYKCSL